MRAQPHLSPLAPTPISDSQKPAKETEGEGLPQEFRAAQNEATGQTHVAAPRSSSMPPVNETRRLSSTVSLQLRAWQPEDPDRVQGLDRAAFGVARRRVLDLLGRQAHSALVYEEAGGEIAGYAILRPGARAWYLGPVVAGSAELAEPLIVATLAQTQDRPVIWDIPDSQGVAAAWARRYGFTPQRQLTRMFLGENVQADTARQFAIAGPEIG